MAIVKFKRTIRKSGGSAAIALPPEILEAMGWKVGESVEVYAEESKVIVKKP
jgi:antitoxin component of MazEF toxin-antitoxin module